ncbi:MAG: UDP-3-O-acyl-N-acetylglucosamine deacetylase [Desulfobacterales bacterium]
MAYYHMDPETAGPFFRWVFIQRHCPLTIKPAPPNFALISLLTCRLSLHDSLILNRPVVDVSLATVIGEEADGCIVSTIEHVMSCLVGLAIDNVIIEIDGHETPIMDGSATLFTRKIREAGIVNQDAPRMYFVIKEPIILEENGKSVKLYPWDKFTITYTIDFDHLAIGTQTMTLDVTETTFEEEIARARTFGFLQSWNT